MRTQSIRPKFVTSFPSAMEDGVLYISEEYETAGHKCCCGCGEKVMTPLHPAKWRLTKSTNGAVSLYPSIGNWKFSCQSHYWIRDNRVIPAGMLSKQRIEAVKARDKRDSQQYIDQTNQAMKKAEQIKPAAPRQEGLMDMIVNKLRGWWK
jgi:Family of unknown function (DUF6527)